MYFIDKITNGICKTLPLVFLVSIVGGTRTIVHNELKVTMQRLFDEYSSNVGAGCHSAVMWPIYHYLQQTYGKTYIDI